MTQSVKKDRKNKESNLNGSLKGRLMNEKRVRDLFAYCWIRVPTDEILVATQLLICKEIFLETATQANINFNKSQAKMFLKMAYAISRLSHFHGLRKGIPNDVPLYYWKHLGFIMATYKDAANYCYENYDKIAHFNFIGGRPKKDIKSLSDLAQKREKEIMAEIASAQETSFDIEEFKALHELFCFVIQTILGNEAFAKYIKEVNESFVYLRKCQAQFDTQATASQKPS